MRKSAFTLRDAALVSLSGELVSLIGELVRLLDALTVGVQILRWDDLRQPHLCLRLRLDDVHKI